MEWDINLKVLVIGCGGIGSEVIKLLTSMGILPTIVDFDVIEISNLSRQFYFTREDSGKYKSEIISKKKFLSYRISKLEKLERGYFDKFDIIFSCVDSISCRMEINYLFVNSKAKLLIDCGVEGTKTHIKKVVKNNATNDLTSSCLYCIKELYDTRQTPYLCSVLGNNTSITIENRHKALLSLIFKLKDEHSYLISDKNRIDDFYKLVVRRFNNLVDKELRTNIFEVKGLDEDIVPNSSYINSICASYAVIFALNHSIEDFFYHDGEFDLFLRKIKIERDKDCFVCKDK